CLLLQAREAQKSSHPWLWQTGVAVQYTTAPDWTCQSGVSGVVVGLKHRHPTRLNFWVRMTAFSPSGLKLPGNNSMRQAIVEDSSTSFTFAPGFKILRFLSSYLHRTLWAGCPLQVGHHLKLCAWN
ncbi:MAG: hypothetical protein AAF327_25905, partial [Cyanobacteria bacterium P01_A01_bin.37]